MAAAEKYPPKIRCERNLVSHLTAVTFSRVLWASGRAARAATRRLGGEVDTRGAVEMAIYQVMIVAV